MPPDAALARIDLTSLQLFVAVCETGGIGRAAQREGIAASAISKRLTELEQQLGTPLLVRHARGVDVTPAGQSALHHARAVVFGLQKLQGEMGEYAAGVRGHVRVHASLSAVVQFLPEDLGAFVVAHPAVKIDLEEHLSGDVLRAVAEGAADLGVCNAAETALGTPALELAPYRHDHLALIVPQTHALSARAAIDFEETLAFDHVGLLPNSSIALAMQRAAAAARRPMRLRVRVSGLDVMCRMIAGGLGVGVMPQRAFELLRGAGALAAVPLSDPWAARTLSLAARDFASLPATARALVAHLRQTAPGAADSAAAPDRPAALADVASPLANPAAICAGAPTAPRPARQAEGLRGAPAAPATVHADTAA